VVQAAIDSHGNCQCGDPPYWGKYKCPKCELSDTLENILQNEPETTQILDRKLIFLLCVVAELGSQASHRGSGFCASVVDECSKLQLPEDWDVGDLAASYVYWATHGDKRPEWLENDK
jgi:hypothetical protein